MKAGFFLRLIGGKGSGTTAAAPQPDIPKIYPVHLVGEQYYPATAHAAEIGDAVEILAEPDNPFDPDALVVVDARGRTLGYVPRDSWLHEALLGEGKGCSAVIEELEADRRGFWNVRIGVTINRDGAIGERGYVPAVHKPRGMR
ncbi:MAG TPA: HIRAN domain-containing protein [Sphingopyxis sp.]|nr:HIRAN domain-containing protein [Sphingopyxis sp.]HMP43925.1 HIRAN domain-containing protein [Sphingopyxis sp.]HMQ18092.1 HIRAN domain-containing protein [Sphingopyxis sp.]